MDDIQLFRFQHFVDRSDALCRYELNAYIHPLHQGCIRNRGRGIEPPRASAPLLVEWVMSIVMEWIWCTFSLQAEPPMTRQMQHELGYRPVVSRELGLMAMQAT